MVRPVVLNSSLGKYLSGIIALKKEGWAEAATAHIGRSGSLENRRLERF
jgi:hypothetical protein